MPEEPISIPILPAKHAEQNQLKVFFYNFLYRNDNITMEKTDYGFRYNTRPMLKL